jgi:hypothetical protein
LRLHESLNPARKGILREFPDGNFFEIRLEFTLTSTIPAPPAARPFNFSLETAVRIPPAQRDLFFFFFQGAKFPSSFSLQRR